MPKHAGPETLPDWIGAQVNGLAAIGGVPKALVPDNLKAGVTKPSRYEPGINRTYQDLADHYGCVVLPTRIIRPRDKAKVEVAVQIIERFVLAKLRNQRFFSLAELNAAIRDCVATINNKFMRGFGQSRTELLEAIDRPALNALPVTAYSYAEWKRARVAPDYHIEVGGHYYSVPSKLIREIVDARITGVTTKLNAGAAAVNVATGITYQPISNLIKSLTYGNALTETAAHTLDYEQSQCTVANGATPVSGFTILRGDALNITGITDTVAGANSQTLGHSPANRLNSATGAYGSKTWIFDGVGNRTSETNAGVTDSYTYPATNNKLQSIVRNAATVRSFTYDGAGNIATDVRSGTTFAYGYNNANRLNTVTSQGNLLGT